MSGQTDSVDLVHAPIGPDTDDEAMAAWLSAAATGQLPSPSLTRWQVLRSGAVNLWEFDVAEYWFAGGRAQFVGQNKSGKSTLMALTTLIMLAGDLDRQLVDTFGQSHKSFRYYVEPTSESTDRRDSGDSASRGWAWVEYGRLVDDRPEFFTTLLYAQTRRGANDYTKTWATCAGAARVGDGLILHRSAATLTPGDLSDVPGYETAKTGTEYQERLATSLFGFESVDRLKAIVRMLKVLRTPHLGQKLDPAFFTAQMREALPAIASEEVDGLADGWDELDRLAADRDGAQSARDAVAGYLRKAWNPWADAVLRRHADDLISAVTRFDNVTRGVREAEDCLAEVQSAHRTLTSDLEDLVRELKHDTQEHLTLLSSRAYVDAQGATDQVKALQKAAEGEDKLAGIAENSAGAVLARTKERRSESTLADEAVTRTESELAARVGPARQAAQKSGLPEAAMGWVADGDGDRLSAAITTRRGHVKSARALLSTVTKAVGAEESAERAFRSAEKELTRRGTQAEQASGALTESLQRVSDDLERWAQGLGDASPDVSLRRHWVEQVTAHANSTAPQAALGTLVRTTWLASAVAPLAAGATLAQATAREQKGRAAELDRQAQDVRVQGDSVPAPPFGWTRRPRPAVSSSGAPLWRLIDPAGALLDTGGNPLAEALGRLEAGLAASGLLDVWVTPDGVYMPDRDGNDAVLTPVDSPQAAPTSPAIGNGQRGPSTLSAVLTIAADAGACATTVEAFLSSITWLSNGPATVSSTGSGYALAYDGSWVTPLTGGRAEPSPEGPELIGTAARQASRARTLAHLESQSALATAAAEDETQRARGLHAQADELERHANEAPRDHDVVSTALAAGAARCELVIAEAANEKAYSDFQLAQQASAAASTELLTFAGTHLLGRDEDALSHTSGALDKAVSATNELLAARARLGAARTNCDSAQIRLDEAERELVAAKTSASDLRSNADDAALSANVARKALGRAEEDLLSSATTLARKNEQTAIKVEATQKLLRTQEAVVAKAESRRDGAAAERTQAEERRDAALAAWWIPVDAGLAAARAVPEATGRSLTPAVGQARAAREKLHPIGWPDTDATAEKEARAQAAWTKLTGPAMTELRTVLESSGGRSVTVLDAPEDGSSLPAVAVLVDSSGTTSTPNEAVARLDAQAAALAALHDEKMQEVLVELLASTFVEHLRDRLKSVVRLLGEVNAVLAAHPTGADNTTLRLTRHPAAGQHTGHAVLTALEGKSVDAVAVQTQVTSFLEQQIREAQERARSGSGEWKEHLAALLDYRCWFDVRTEYRVGQAGWAPLTTEIHGKDSGGGKVVTLLQPLLATLVAMYGDAVDAPRPVWLDEAFTAVDDLNRTAMLALLVEFDLDFLLAGPVTLVTSAQVPSAAVWSFTRAPEPLPGVDLSLALWAGRTLTTIKLPAVSFSGPVRNQAKDSGLNLFTSENDDPDERATSGFNEVRAGSESVAALDENT